MHHIYGSPRFAAIATEDFFARLTTFLAALIITNLLALFIDDVTIGWVLAGASVATAFSIGFFPRIFVRYGTKNVLITLAAAQCVFLVGLAFADNVASIAVLYALHSVCAYAVFLGLDLLLEAESADEATGRLRGIFLVVANTAVLIAPFIIGIILQDDNFRDVFLTAAIFMVPFCILGATLLPNISHSAATHVSVISGFRELPRRLSLVPVMLAHFLVLSFFIWEVYYIPLYLHDHIGLSWQVVSTLFAISVLPYVFFEYPMGRIADKYLGEKEMVLGGFVILAIGMATFSAIPGTNIVAWAVLIFIANIGGAAIEVMTESHFFKRVSIADTNLIGLFRMLRPLAAIAAPIVASLALLAVPFSFVFAVFGVVLLLGIPLALMMVDTR